MSGNELNLVFGGDAGEPREPDGRYRWIDDPRSWLRVHYGEDRQDRSAGSAGSAGIGSEHRRYAELPAPAESRSTEQVSTPWLYCVWWTPRPGTESGFHEWYDVEHIPLLMTIPGWLRIRRYELIEGPGPRFLALHDLSSPDAISSPEHDVVYTPWRDRTVADRIESDHRVYRLDQAGDRAHTHD